MSGGEMPPIFGDFKMNSHLGIDLGETHVIPQEQPGKIITVEDTTYIYLKNRSATTELGGVFAFDAILFTWESWANNAQLTGKVRPLAIFNRDLNKDAIRTGDIPANHYAWAAISGKMKVFVLTLCAKDVPLYTSATAGYLDDTSTTQTLIQNLHTTATNAGGSFALVDAYATAPMRS